MEPLPLVALQVWLLCHMGVSRWQETGYVYALCSDV